MNKVLLYIKDSDGTFQEVDLFEDETITVTSKIQDIRDIAKIFTDFSQSFTLEPKQYSAKATISPTASFMLVVLDFIRGLVRPGLTIYLCAITTMMYLEAKVIMAGVGALISAEQAITVHNIIVTTVLYLTTTCVLWWFGTRNSQKPPTRGK